MSGRTLGLRLGIGGLALAALTTASSAPARAEAPSEPRVACFEASDALLANPERGFYVQRRSDRVEDLGSLRGERRITLLLVTIDLRDYKDRDLDAAKLDEVRGAFEAAHAAGLKVIARAAYGFTGRDYRADPMDLDRIRGHIAQLGAVYAEHADVLFAVQAGLLGPWGEWHGSSWGNPPSLEARRAVLLGLLDAVPEPIPVQIRRPMFVRDIFDGEHELTAEDAYGGSKLARTGWHNDALLCLPSDMGTYAQRGWDRRRELAWSDNHTRHTPFGGETVPGSEETPIKQVVHELKKLHATYLNSGYHRGTLNAWREATIDGENAFQLIERRLGYRLVAERLEVRPQAAPGEAVAVELTLRNVGFASPHLPREVALVLRPEEGDGPSYRTVLDDVDPRRWDPELDAFTISGAVPLPADAPPGRYRLALHLADPSPRLRDDPRYAIRLASKGVPFDDQTGENVLADDIEVE